MRGTADSPAGFAPPTAHPGYRPDIDGLRAVAVLAVLADHTALVTGGLVGVDIFFVISGFLISRIILGALARGRFSLLDFYARRVKRIFPALLVVVAAVCAVGWWLLLPDEYQSLGGRITAGTTFTLNFFQHNPFYAGPSSLLLDHLWSLGVEEQFYLLWPLLLLVTAPLRRGQFIVIASLAALSFVVNIVTSYHDPRLAYELPWTRLWELALGGALAYIQLHGVAGWDGFAPGHSPHASAGQRLAQHLWSLLGGGLIVASVLSHIRVSVDPGWWAVAPCAGALLLISAGPQGLVNRYVLSTRVMVFLGLISYPLYLWHFPLLQGPAIPGFGLRFRWALAALGATFILSYLTYKYVELPVRTSKNLRRLPGLLCASLAACAVFGVLVSDQRITPRSEPPGVRKMSAAALEDWLPGTRGTFWTRFPASFLDLGAGPRRVLYLGDGNMQQYYPRIAKVLADHGGNTHRAVFAVRDQCAPGAIDVAETDDVSRATCRAFVARAFEYAGDPAVDTVVIAACWSCYFMALHDVLQSGNGDLKPGSEAALGNLQRAIGDLTGAHKRVYVVLDSPVGLDFDPHQMVLRTVLPPGFRVVVRLPERIEISRRLAPVGRRLRQIAQASGATVIDPFEWLCDASSCPALSPGGEPLYRDWARLRPSYVRESVSFLDDTILDPPAAALQSSQPVRSRPRSFDSLSISSR